MWRFFPLAWLRRCSEENARVCKKLKFAISCEQKINKKTIEDGEGENSSEKRWLAISIRWRKLQEKEWFNDNDDNDDDDDDNDDDFYGCIIRLSCRANIKSDFEPVN